MTADEFNAAYPIGTEVAYFPFLGSFSHMRSRTRSEAWELGHGAVVVAIEGRAGGVSIGHITIEQ